jgi:hypothetical protein
MKFLLKLSIFFLVPNAIYSQSAITFFSPDMPIPTTGFNYDEFTALNPTQPTIGVNKSWNYATYFGNSPSSVDFYPEVDPFYTAAGVDVYFQSFKTLSPNLGLGYLFYSELDFNQNGVDDKGIYIDEQVFSLEALTGSITDNLTFPLQGYLTNGARRVVKFPMTNSTHWTSSVRKANDFTLKVAAFGLNNTPCQHVYTIVRQDSIVGWGKLRVHTATGPSIAYDVLIDKLKQYSIDSFYVAGAPAPAALMTAFSVSQGQISDVTHQYNFYRLGSYSYLMRFHYGADASYTNLEYAYINTDNLTTETTGISETTENTYSTVLFPNPSNGSEINLTILGKDLDNVSYTITDLSGKILQSADNQVTLGNTLTVKLANELSNGMYFLQVKDKKEVIVAGESFGVQR